MTGQSAPPPSSPAQKVGLIVRFVPDGLSWRSIDGGKPQWRLRGSLALLPDTRAGTQGAIDLDRWPEEIAGLLHGSKGGAWVRFDSPMVSDLVSGAFGGASNARILHPAVETGAGDAHVLQAGRLWRALMAPPLDLSDPDSLHPEVRYLAEVAGEQGPFADAWATLHAPWRALHSALDASLEPTAKVSLAGEGPRVSATPSLRVADLAAGVGAIRMLSSLAPPSFSHRKAQDNDAPIELPIRAFGRHLTRSLGLTALFAEAAGGGRTAAAAYPGKGPMLRAGGDQHVSRVQRLLEIRRTPPPAPPAPPETPDPSAFSRIPPPQQSPPPLPAGLALAVENVLTEDHKASLSLRASLKSEADAFGKLSARSADSADRVRAWLKTSPWVERQNAPRRTTVLEQMASILSGNPKPAQATLDEAAVAALAAHLCATRPDAGLAPSVRPLVAGLSGMAVPSDDELHKAAIELADAPSRRFFGIFAYPALARALNLILDVEIDLAALAEPEVANRLLTAPSAQGVSQRFFAVAASLTPSGHAEIWSACKFSGTENSAAKDGARFVTAIREELAVALARQLSVTDADAVPPTLDGVLNLGVALDGRPRFHLESIDVVSHAEQLISKAKSDTGDTGRPLKDMDGHAPDRTAGVALIDAARTLEVEQQLAAAPVKSAQLANGSGAEPLILYGDDLTIGYRLDVGVVARAGPTKGRVTWRSLMRRRLQFGKVQAEHGAVDVEALIDRVLTTSAPIRDPNMAPAEAADFFRAQIDEASVRGASRLAVSEPQTVGEHPTDADVIAQQTMAIWSGDPLGAPCSPDTDGSEVDPARDLGLSVTVGMPENSPADVARRPPRLEIGRSLTFGARQALIGGAGISVEEASEIYNSAAGAQLTQPPRAEPAFRFLRHERIGKANIAALHRPFKKLHDPRGDTLTTMVVRSGDFSHRTSRTQRVIYAPGVPQAFAALHPADPSSGGHRALDGLPIVGGRPVGGLPHVLLDPLTGGLPVKSKWGIRFATRYGPKRKVRKLKTDRPVEEGLFVLRANGYSDIADRKAPYYPDPAVEGLVIELWSRGPSAHVLSGPGNRVVIPIYDPHYSQSVPYGLYATPCIYPYAMPLLVDLETLDDEASGVVNRIEFDPAHDTGVMIGVGGFLTYARDLPPPPGSTTLRRVRVRLKPGEDYDVKVWATVPKARMSWFAAVDNAVRLLHFAGGGSHGSQGNSDSSGLYEGVKKVLGVDLNPYGEKSNNKVLTRLHEHFAQSIEAGPMSDRSEVITFRVVHAAQRPPAPSLSALAPRIGLELVRRTFKSDDVFEAWSAGEGKDDWTDLSETSATTTWFKGPMNFDVRRADRLTVEASYLDVLDDPTKPPPLKNGKLAWETAHTILFDQALADDPYAASDAALNLLTANTGAYRDLSHKFTDTHARKLTLTPSATSRHAAFFMQPGQREPKENFIRKGRPLPVWLPSTRRPASLEQVEILPAFIWRSRSGAATRTTWLRLQWRRRLAANPGHSHSREISSNLWYSSGEGERLALLLDVNASGSPGGPGPVAPDVETEAQFKTYWARDPIRRGRAPLQQFIRPSDLAANLTNQASGDPDSPAWANNLQMPLPGGDNPDATKPVRYAPRQALTFAPTYVPEEDLWRVDLQLDTRDLAGPWLQLCLARYQEHALFDSGRDLRLSEPLMVECPLAPYREVQVTPLPREKGETLWPIEIVVKGPLGVISGGAEEQTDPVLKDRLSNVTRSRFTASLLEGFSRADYKRHKGLGGETVLQVVTSDIAPPPNDADEVLWRIILHAPLNPHRKDLYVFVREVDLMLPASPDVSDAQLTESGTRFSAKVRV